MGRFRSIENLVVAYPKLPDSLELDPAVVRTLDAYEVLSFLTGAPLFSAGSYIESLYGKAWTPSEDLQTWTVTFKDSIGFSDNTKLTATHWYHSLARTVLVGAGVHFNPRKDLLGAEQSEDGYCEGLHLDGDKVTLRLVAPNQQFPRFIGKIEASVLPISSSSQKQIDMRTLPSAGPYSIVSYEKKEAVLKKNPSFPGHTGRLAPQTVELLELSDEEAVRARIGGKVDFAFPSFRASGKLQEQLEKTSQVIRDFGQTIFLSFRTKSKSSEWDMNREARAKLAGVLRKIPPFSGLDTASVLFMGEGLGRIASGPPVASHTKNYRLPRLTLTAVDRSYSRHIVDHLQNFGVDLDVTWVSDFNSLYVGSAKDSEAMLGWNDFCAQDPYISLYNALNPDRPLFPDDGTLREELTRIQQESGQDQRDGAYKALHKRILEDFKVIPIFHYWMDAYAAKGLNIGSIKGGVLWTLEP